MMVPDYRIGDHVHSLQDAGIDPEADGAADDTRQILANPPSQRRVPIEFGVALKENRADKLMEAAAAP